MILHTLNASPSSAAFNDCLRLLRAGDAVLLLGDGIYGATLQTAACESLQASGAELYVLRRDAEAAGLIDRIDARLFVDMDGFVVLTERFTRQQAWY
ncbi:MAG: sulfur relay protein TusB/DsrH [Halioglobus sp.]|jgi:sulfur relay protein TusB/DsrH